MRIRNFPMKFDLSNPVAMPRMSLRQFSVIGVGAAMLAGSAISAGGQLGGGILASSGAGKTKKISTFSKNQKQMDQLLFDFLMGIRRDEKGRELGRSPLLRKFANRKIPQRRVAPLTESQQGILAKARGMADRVSTRKRPDPVRQKQLARGILPGEKGFEAPPRYLKHGGKVRPGEKAYVGDDGMEMIEALPGGGVEVTPNPKTMSSPESMAAAMAKSEKIEKLTGKRALAVGTRRYLEGVDGGAKTYLDYDYGGGFGNFFDEPGSAAQRGFEDYLGEQYQTARTTAGTKEGKDVGGGDWRWYEDFQRDYGGDIGAVPYVPKKKGTRAGGPGGKIQTGYLGGLQDWWRTLPTATGNDQLDAAIGGMPEELKAGFGTYMNKQAGNQLATNPWTQVGGQWTFSDPFDVDVGNVSKWASDYIAASGYEANPDFNPGGAVAGEGDPGFIGPPDPAAVADPGVNVTDPYIKTPTEADVPVDYSGLVGSLAGPDGFTAETLESVNTHLANWKGGVLGGVGVDYNPATGQYELGTNYGGEFIPAPSNKEAGLTEAVGDYTAGDIAVAPEPGAGAEPGLDDRLLSTLEPLLAGITSAEFDPETDLAQFDAGVAVPAGKRFTEYTVPAIEQALGGGAIRSGGREKHIEKARSDLDEYLISEQADWMRNAEDTFENRRQLGINQAMTLATLPTEIANAKISGQATRAMIANTWNNIDINNAIADSNITNAELSGLVTLWSLFSGEQLQTNNEFAAEFANAFAGEGKVPFNEILGILSRYQAEPQTAIVTS